MKKQETLEEVIPMTELVVFLDKIKKNLTNKTEVLTIQLIIDTIKNEFVDKEIKWQQERMYSEEDMKKCWQEATEDMRKQFSTSYAGMTFEKWFEQFKNK